MKNKNVSINKLGLLKSFLFALIILALAAAAYSRNAIYLTPVTLWADMVRKAPDKRRTHENYGQALSSAGFYQEALREFQTVLALPDDGSVPPRDVYRELGVVYFRLNLIDESIIAWQKGLTFAPFDAGLLNNLSIAYMRKGRYEEALTSAEMASQQDRFLAAPFNTLGEIYLSKGDTAKAIHNFERAMYLEPHNPARHWNIALAYEKAGNYQLAYQHASRYLSLERDPRMRYNAMNFVNQLQQKMTGK